MNCVLFLSAVALMLAAVHFGQTEAKFDLITEISKTKNLKILSDCFMGTGPCNALSQAFKDQVLVDGIEHACSNCKLNHKRIFKAFLGGLKQNYPADYEAFKQKYDPQSKYLASLEAAVANVE